jgi:anti-sigma regulatory factor (Ser/Thr protein kinase)
MRLAQDLDAATQARRFARRWSAAHALPAPIVDDVELVVAELVTNAVRHGEPPIELELSEPTEGTIRGEICDGSRIAPVPNAAPDFRGGFGLRIVDARTSRWGTTARSDGKYVGSKSSTSQHEMSLCELSGPPRR